MRLLFRTVLVVTPLAALVLSGARVTLAQGESRSVQPVVIMASSTRAAVAALDARIAQMVAAGELVRTYAATDRLAPNRRQEYFAQRHQGLPVLGGGVSRQLADNVTVSAFGPCTPASMSARRRGWRPMWPCCVGPAA